MKNLAIARRYAKALLLIGEDDGEVDVYREELSCFAKLLEENWNLSSAIMNPLYSDGSRKNLLLAVLERLDFSHSVSSFFVLLFDKDRISFIADINKCYEILADESKGIARASLVSAVEMSRDSIEKIRVALSSRTGKNVVLEVEQDSELIGGIVATIGDLVLDGSVRTQLLNIGESLRRSESV